VAQLFLASPNDTPLYSALPLNICFFVVSATYVKLYVPRQKNDAADAAGIYEAVTRPPVRFVGARTLGEPGSAHPLEDARDAGGAMHATDQRNSRALGRDWGYLGARAQKRLGIGATH